ncbi:MAG TPA: ABC transporter substrate-binding protein [Acidimicrobiia bacterium]|nr:ABC transporter substrate-binding protein [Acidimicrobiia bacterium]
MRRRVRVLSVMTALLLVVAACGDGGAESTTTTGGGATTTQGGTDTTGGQSTTTSAAGPSGDPIVVGGTLPLTGGLSATGIIHQIAGQLFVDRLNEAGGLLGRPVEWNLIDDTSDGARIAELYEQLISQDAVDLIMGPYATPNILAAMPVAERHGFVLPQHTAVLAPALTYECQFPGWSIGPAPNEFIPNQLADLFDSMDGAVSTVALVTNEGGSTSFVSYGRPDVEEPSTSTILPERGYEVVADIPYPIGNTEWGPIAASLQDAQPDAVLVMGLGVEANGLIEAMQQVGFTPPVMFALFPAPGPLLGMGEASNGLLSVSMFEPNEPILADLDSELVEIIEEFSQRVADAGLPYTVFETQAAASWNAWSLLAQGVEGAGSLDHAAICDYLHENGADLPFAGQVSFDQEQNNFWPSNQVLKQIQDGDWVVVWPEDQAAAEPLAPTG